MPQTLRAHSTTASWKPRQIPRYGTFCSRAHLTASIIPSVPRSPKPPGTRIPLVEIRKSPDVGGELSTHPADTTAFQASWYFAGLVTWVSGSKSDALTHCCSPVR